MHSALLSLVLTVIAFSGLAASAAIVLMALSLLRPPRMTDGRAAWLVRRLSPGDLGLTFEYAPLTVRDERTGGARLTLTGWWIPSRACADRCVILLHDYGDAKVGVIAGRPSGMPWISTSTRSTCGPMARATEHIPRRAFLNAMILFRQLMRSALNGRIRRDRSCCLALGWGLWWRRPRQPPAPMSPPSSLILR